MLSLSLSAPSSDVNGRAAEWRWKRRSGIVSPTGASALEWVLDQRKEKRVKAPTVAAKFPPQSFSERKENVIESLHRICTVSVETMKIIREMEETQ